MANPTGAKPAETPHPGLRLIAIIKFIKAVLLLAVGLGGLRLLNRDLAEIARTWARHLSIDPENRFAHWVIAKAAQVQPIKLRHFSEIILLLSLDQVVEGVGLWFNQGWAKYLLLVATSVVLVRESYFLVFDLVHHRTPYWRAVTLAVTIAILVYLVIILVHDRRRSRPARG